MDICGCNDANCSCHGKKPQKTEEHKHPCPECSKCFFGPGTLNMHIRTHTGEQPFWCPILTCPWHYDFFFVKSNMVWDCRSAYALEEDFLISRDIQINTLN